MKKVTYIILISMLCLGIILTSHSTTKQCVNYKCTVIKIPLYLKLLNFFDRHFNYSYLTKGILRDSRAQEEQVLLLYEWTRKNVRKTPAGFPVIDDHVWHIIIRGYGEADQMCDVFATLCNYARSQASFGNLENSKGGRKTFAFVRLRNGWSVFDVSGGCFFRNREGRLATVQDILEGNWLPVCPDAVSNREEYQDYFGSLKGYDFNQRVDYRSAIQSPLRRFIFWKRSGT